MRKIILIGTLFLVLASLILGGCAKTGEATGLPDLKQIQAPQAPALVRANSCDRDAVCEIKELSLTARNSSSGNNEVFIKINSSGLFTPGVIKAEQIIMPYYNGGIIIGYNHIRIGDMYLNDGGIYHLNSQKVNINNLSIEGLASHYVYRSRNDAANYLCINSFGEVFKSPVPCERRT